MRRRGAIRTLFGLTSACALSIACSSSPRETPPAIQASSTRASSQAPAVATASAALSASAAPLSPVVAVRHARALEVLFAGKRPAPCTEGDTRCLVSARFSGHDSERTSALALFDEIGDVVGTEEEHEMEGGFRGTIHLVPELPVGQYKKHLEWVLRAQRDIAAFQKAIEDKHGSPVPYRNRALVFRFMRSVGRTTPSAYAADWEVGYNVSGSLHANADAVRETIFHEVFHLNDQAHGGWSRRVIGPTVDAIAQKCSSKTVCLTPYAPGKTMVRGGTYYAFQPDNGDIAHEYAAELATRYFTEQRAALKGEAMAWFKCGPKENAETMTALAKEFFGGVDLTPACK